MGRGNKRSKKGKICRGSFGKSRPKIRKKSLNRPAAQA
jgi:ribosomal small subunit protein bTHX